MNSHHRARILATFGASVAEIDELLAYNHNSFDRTGLTWPIKFPLAPEPHVATWKSYAMLAEEVGTFEALQSRLVELQFPIRAGLSQTETYCAATRRGVSTAGMSEATGLRLQHPEQLRLVIHDSLAGAIPVLIAVRADFVMLVQALTKRNEPEPIPDSMGACIVRGFNNWHRVQQYRQQWERENTIASEAAWRLEFQRLTSQKENYQDRFILLSEGPYSGVAACDLGLSEAEWLSRSLTLRLEHECTHYFTLRLLNCMRNNVLDELIADYRGIVAVNGRYRADWFLRFLGLEAFPTYRTSGRLHNYRGRPVLSDGAFRVLQALVKSAAENLEHFDRQSDNRAIASSDQPLMLLALTCLTLEELASPEAMDYLQTTLDSLRPVTLVAR
jgi:hypothetical protein